MSISGQLFIGDERIGMSRTFRAVNPATGEALQPDFSAADQEAVERACVLAWSAFDRLLQLRLIEEGPGSSVSLSDARVPTISPALASGSLYGL